MVDHQPAILGHMNGYLNNVEDSKFDVPSSREMLILDPAQRIFRAIQLEQNTETIEFLQLSEAKHLEHVAADAAVGTATFGSRRASVMKPFLTDTTRKY